MSNQPYFIDKLDLLVDEFYDQFENEMGEYLFVFMTETDGRHKRSVHEAAEQVNVALRGLDWQKLVDDEYDEYQYDQSFMDAQALAGQIMKRMVMRYAEEY